MTMIALGFPVSYLRACRVGCLFLGFGQCWDERGRKDDDNHELLNQGVEIQAAGGWL